MRGVQYWQGNPPDTLNYEQVLLLHELVSVEDTLGAHGFQFLDTFQTVVMLTDYDDIAMMEQADTGYQTEIPSVRVPLYCPEVMWLRNEPDVVQFLRLWNGELSQAVRGAERLAFLTALYRARLTMWVLPPR